ncbi:MFS transporter [Alicyclobacillus kakegawensis]|uniref:MFS transporter n=1 Tax=Alicyclobacillus kakegawensis TaxID=392012 RepID=UPI000836E6B9|nr:MFS transporter [Alicyclobacillus kakegawensis]
MSVRRTWFMASIGLGILLNPLNSSMISVAIAKLQSVYRINFTDVSWIIFAYYISSAIAQPVMGKAGDLFGRKRVFLAGLAVVSITSMFAPLSPNFGWLIGFRVVQSIGTSMIAAVGMAMVRIYVTEKQAGALSVLSVFMSGASAFGPSIGGFLIHWWNWPAIFYVNIPFIITSFVLASWAIPSDNRATPVSIKMSFRTLSNLVDGLGILFFCVGMVGILIAVLSSKTVGNCAIGMTGLIAMALFVWRELRETTPFIPLRSFGKYPAMTWVHLQFVLVNVLYYSLFFGLPTYLQEERNLSSFNAGFLMLSLGLCSLVASPIAGRWIDKSGPRPALLLSGILMVLGAVWMATLQQTSPVINVCLVLAAFGLANGLNNVGMQAALFKSTPKEIIGVSSGLFQTSRYLGTILSSLLLDIVFRNSLNARNFEWLGAVLAVIAVLFLFMSWSRRMSTYPPELSEQ